MTKTGATSTSESWNSATSHNTLALELSVAIFTDIYNINQHKILINTTYFLITPSDKYSHLYNGPPCDLYPDFHNNFTEMLFILNTLQSPANIHGLK